MTEREREATALFRFGVIGELTNTVLGRGEKARLMREKSRARYRFPDGREGRLSRSTLKAWLRAYGREGLDGLKPKPRADRGTVRALRPEVQGVIRQLRVENPAWGVPEVMNHLRETGILALEEEVSLGVVYRLIGPGRAAEGGKADRRKYGFEKALECVQADVMYGPHVTMADGKRRVVKREELEPLFRHQTTRRVNRDRTFPLKGKVFEAPVDLVGERIEVFYNPASPDAVEVVWGGRSYGLARPLDLHVNRHVRRGLRFDRDGGRHA
jgi:hypothetical protein